MSAQHPPPPLVSGARLPLQVPAVTVPSCCCACSHSFYSVHHLSQTSYKSKSVNKSTFSTKHVKRSNPNVCQLPPFSVTQQHFLKLALLNTHSLNNRALILNEFITDTNLDSVCVTETLHKHVDSNKPLPPDTPTSTSPISVEEMWIWW